MAVVSGSIGVLSEAIHSGLDLMSSLVTFFVIRASGRPADWDHPFGHGKLENLSAMLEAFLLIAAGGYIVFEGISSWTRPHVVHHVGWALWVIGASVVVNVFVYFQNRGVARDHESIAIETNSFHFLTDAFSSLAVFIGLAVIHFTGWMVVDSILALLIAVYMFWVGLDQMKKSVNELSDTALPVAEVESIRAILAARSEGYLNFHDLRTRKAGATRYIELHLTVCSELRVHEAHAVCDLIEEDLNKQFRQVHANIHVEPCGNHGPPCVEVCQYYSEPRTQVRSHV